jgi:hypothetical protein
VTGAFPQPKCQEFEPGEHHGEKQIIGHSRQEQQQRGGQPGSEGVTGIASPQGTTSQPPPQEEKGEKQGEVEEHEGQVVDEAV